MKKQLKSLIFTIVTFTSMTLISCSKNEETKALDTNDMKGEYAGSVVYSTRNAETGKVTSYDPITINKVLVDDKSISVIDFPYKPIMTYGIGFDEETTESLAAMIGKIDYVVDLDKITSTAESSMTVSINARTLQIEIPTVSKVHVGIKDTENVLYNADGTMQISINTTTLRIDSGYDSKTGEYTISGDEMLFADHYFVFKIKKIK